MSYDSPRAIPVKWKHRTVRQLCLEKDDDYQRESLNPVEYEFERNGKKRTFRGRYQQRGPYAEE